MNKVIPTFILKNPCIEYLEKIKKNKIEPILELGKKIAIEVYRQKEENNYQKKNVKK